MHGLRAKPPFEPVFPEFWGGATILEDGRIFNNKWTLIAEPTKWWHSAIWSWHEGVVFFGRRIECRPRPARAEAQ